jgi:hypothetical protein
MSVLPFVAAAIALSLAVSVHASAPFKGLATAKTAFVVPDDVRGLDRDVAACLSAHLPEAASLTLAPDAKSADLVLRVHASRSSQIGLATVSPAPPTVISPATANTASAVFGEADLVIRDPATPKKIAWTTHVRIDTDRLNPEPADASCAFADRLIENLVKDIRKARDANR